MYYNVQNRSRERTVLKKTLFVWLLLIHCAFASSMITKVIQLHYQQASTVVQLVEPLLGYGEQITGNGQTIVVKVRPQTLTQLRVLLHKIDQPPVTFEVSVYQGDPNWLNNQNSNDFVISTNSQQQQRRSQSVNVMNGESAFISTGQDQPVITNIGADWWGGGVRYERKMVETGLLVEPTLQGQQVKLSVKQIRQQDSQMSNQNFDTQKFITTMMVPLNKWVQLGSAQNAQQSANTISVGNNFTQSATLFVKVKIVSGGTGNQ